MSWGWKWGRNEVKEVGCTFIWADGSLISFPIYLLKFTSYLCLLRRHSVLKIVVVLTFRRKFPCELNSSQYELILWSPKVFHLSNEWPEAQTVIAPLPHDNNPVPRERIQRKATLMPRTNHIESRSWTTEAKIARTTNTWPCHSLIERLPPNCLKALNQLDSCNKISNQIIIPSDNEETGAIHIADVGDNCLVQANIAADHAATTVIDALSRPASQEIWVAKIVQEKAEKLNPERGKSRRIEKAEIIESPTKSWRGEKWWNKSSEFWVSKGQRGSLLQRFKMKRTQLPEIVMKQET